MDNLTGCEKINPMPESESKQALAEEFADYFLEKIDKIRRQLDECELFDPSVSQEILQMNQFKELSEEKVSKVINSIATKSCEYEIILTKTLI